ncbi:hypothetical protein AB1N83_003246 [Pleurotus pulmonarius]
MKKRVLISNILSHFHHSSCATRRCRSFVYPRIYYLLLRSTASDSSTTLQSAAYLVTETRLGLIVISRPLDKMRVLTYCGRLWTHPLHLNTCPTFILKRFAVHASFLQRHLPPITIVPGLSAYPYVSSAPHVLRLKMLKKSTATPLSFWVFISERLPLCWYCEVAVREANISLTWVYPCPSHSNIYKTYARVCAVVVKYTSWLHCSVEHTPLMPRCITLLLRLCGCAPRLDDELADQQKQAQRNSVPKEHDYDVGTPFEPPRRGGYVEYSKRQRRKTRSMTSNFGSTTRREHYGQSQSTLRSGSTVTVVIYFLRPIHAIKHKSQNAVSSRNEYAPPNALSHPMRASHEQQNVHRLLVDSVVMPYVGSPYR